MTNSAIMSYRQEIDTLTAIDKRITEQKFFEENIPDFVDIDEGNGAWDDKIFNNQVFDNAGDGFEGFQVDVSNESRMPLVDIEIDGRLDTREIWNKKVSYKISDLEQVRKAIITGSNNFDIVEKKLEARKRNFDLMLQDVAFVGNKVYTNITGLLNNSNVTVNTTDITQSIGSLSDANFNLLVGALLTSYTNNSNMSERKPNRFIVPYSDWLSLTQYNSVSFPTMSKLEYLENVFKKATMNNDFKILPSPYAEMGGTHTYMLYKKDADNLVLDLPVSYQTTAFNTIDNFTFYNVGYGQVGGVRMLRPQTAIYFTY